MSNIVRFNQNVTAAVAALYKSHPRSITLAPSNLTEDTGDQEDAAAAIEWLHRNGVLSGTLNKMGGGACIVTGAILPASTYRILSEKHRNIDGATVGDFAVQVAEGDGPLKPDNCAFVVQCLVG